MPSDSDKRPLEFRCIDDLVRDVDILASRGYEKKGNWDLAQTCMHINEWMRYPMDGFPQAPAPIRIMLWLMKKTVGPGMKKKILAEGFSSGMMTDPKTVPSAGDISEEEAVRKLRETAIRLSEYQSEMHASPLFGEMDVETALKVGLMHAAHHLGFLHPR